MANVISDGTGNIWWCVRIHYLPNITIMVAVAAARGEGDQIYLFFF